MERSFMSPHACSRSNCELAGRRLRSARSGYQTAGVVTKEAFWILVLLSSLGVWAALWAVGASLASAWFQ